ncbi:MAG TPA: polyhydroxyalkanoate synthesis regulator DNA-binding domain-containing protein [Anaerolineae bacterium]
MRLIKRYPNRKLYDTEAKQYISLERIAELIREGVEVQVIDHATRDDLTTVTLTQVIFEQEKKQDNELPRTILTALIRAGGDTVTSLRRTLTSPLDWLHQVDEEIDSRLSVLVKRGEMAEEEARHLSEQLLGHGRRITQAAPAVPNPVERLLSARGTPTRDDIAKLDRQLDDLLAALNNLEEDQPATGAPSNGDGQGS